MNPATGVSSQLGTLSPLKRDGSTVGQRATHIATPWSIETTMEGSHPLISGGGGQTVAVLDVSAVTGDPETDKANAEHIVACVNAHADLLTAVRALVDVLVRCDAENMPNDAEQCTDEQWDAALATGQAVLARVSE